MMFMMPMPPTSREIEPIAANIKVSPDVIELTIVSASFWERTAKSSSRKMRWR